MCSYNVAPYYSSSMASSLCALDKCGINAASTFAALKCYRRPLRNYGGYGGYGN